MSTVESKPVEKKTVKVKKDRDVHLKKSFYYFVLSEVKKPGHLEDPLTPTESMQASILLFSQEHRSRLHKEHDKWMKLMKKSKQL